MTTRTITIHNTNSINSHHREQYLQYRNDIKMLLNDEANITSIRFWTRSTTPNLISGVIVEHGGKFYMMNNDDKNLNETGLIDVRHVCANENEVLDYLDDYAQNTIAYDDTIVEIVADSGVIFRTTNV
jgi:hypothetical protein